MTPTSEFRERAAKAVRMIRCLHIGRSRIDGSEPRATRGTNRRPGPRSHTHGAMRRTSATSWRLGRRHACLAAMRQQSSSRGRSVMADRSNTPLAKETAAQAAERIYHEWDAALGAKHLDAAMALYAPDCVLESPLVRHLLGAELGIVEGREKLREFVRIVFERQPAARQRYREGFSPTGTS